MKSEEYPHSVTVFTPERKQLRSGYTKALDTKRKSGGGRLVAFFHDKCTEIWSGSPATESEFRYGNT